LSELTPYQVAEMARKYGIPQGNYAETQKAVIAASQGTTTPKPTPATKTPTPIQKTTYTPTSTPPQTTKLSPYQVAEIAQREGITQGAYTQTEQKVIQASQQSAEQKRQETLISYPPTPQQVVLGPQEPSPTKTVAAITPQPQQKTIQIAGRTVQVTETTKTIPSTPKTPTQRLVDNMVTNMGPSPSSVTSVLRGAKETFFDKITPEPFKRAEVALGGAQEATSPLGKATSSILTPSRQVKAGADIAIGVVKGGESLVNPSIKTATGTVFGTGIQGITTKSHLPNNPFLKPIGDVSAIKAYGADIKGREGEMIGEAVFDVLFGKAVTKVASKVSKVQVGSKTDEILLAKSKRYRRAAEATLQERPQFVGAPSYGSDELVAPAKSIKEAIDATWLLEQTKGTSGVTAKHLVSQSDEVTQFLAFKQAEAGQKTTAYLSKSGIGKYVPVSANLSDDLGKVGIRTTSSDKLTFLDDGSAIFAPKKGVTRVGEVGKRAVSEIDEPIRFTSLKGSSIITDVATPKETLDFTKNIFGTTKASFAQGTKTKVLSITELTKADPITLELSRLIPKKVMLTPYMSKVAPLNAWSQVLGYGSATAIRVVTGAVGQASVPKQTQAVAKISEVPYAQYSPQIPKQQVATVQLPKQVSVTIPKQTIQQTTVTLPPQKNIVIPKQKQKDVVVPKIGQIPSVIHLPKTVPYQVSGTGQIPDVISATQQGTLQTTVPLQVTEQVFSPSQTTRTKPPMSRPAKSLGFGAAAMPPMIRFPKSKTKREKDPYALWRLKKHPVLTNRQVASQMFGGKKGKKKKFKI